MIHSKFSPASMDAELLEATFVQREPLAGRLVDLFVESATTESKHHVLLVGPRGIGKSHLAALVYHRLSRREDLKDKLLIAFLREDEWGITSFLDLLVRILRSLGTDAEELTSWPPAQVEERAWELLRKRIGGKTLLVIVENLASVFRNLGELGQRKWRALIQNERCWAVLATAPALSADISRQASPFYGFFEIHNLAELSVSEAMDLLARLAKADGRQQTAEMLNTPAGRARVRAVHHLAGGNHRVLVIFYDFLTQEDPDELLAPFLKTIDSLTPYYQSQMDKLSPQQRKLVEFLCEHRGAATVKTIAARCFVSHQTAAAQLKQLLADRYVRVTRLGREAYYELAEPLLRISVEVKTHDSRPLRLLVELLRYWFSREELESRLAVMKPEFAVWPYLAAALAEYQRPDSGYRLAREMDGLVSLMDEASRKLDVPAVMAGAEELAEVAKRAEVWFVYAFALALVGRAAEALPVVEEALEKNPEDWMLYDALSNLRRSLGQHTAALQACESAIRLKPKAAGLWGEKGMVLAGLGDHGKALQAFAKATRLDPKEAGLWLDKGRCLLNLGRPREALKPLARAWELDPRALGLSHPYCEALLSAGEHERALAELPPQVVSEEIFRRLLALSRQNPSTDRLRHELRRWYEWFQRPPGPDVFLTSLGVLAGHLITQPEESFAAATRSLREALGPPFPQSPQVELIRRLLDVAVRYRESGDEKVLMELPLELRKLITG